MTRVTSPPRSRSSTSAGCATAPSPNSLLVPLDRTDRVHTRGRAMRIVRGETGAAEASVRRVVTPNSPTWGDIQAFLAADGWRKLPSAERGGKRAKPIFYEKGLADRPTLETHASHSDDKTVFAGLFGQILRAQLEVSRADFWECIRSGTPVDRPVKRRSGARRARRLGHPRPHRRAPHDFRADRRSQPRGGDRSGESALGAKLSETSARPGVSESLRTTRHRHPQRPGRLPPWVAWMGRCA